MKLSFVDLVVVDFKSFRGEHRLDLDAFDPGLHFVSGDNRDEPRLGPNGAGKSALMVDAIAWCLYGKTPGGLRNPDVRPWQRGGTTMVEVTLKLDKEPVRVMRQTGAQRNSFEIDGKPGDDIGKLTGINFDLFCHTIMLAQGQPLFFDLPPRDKMRLFVDVLELDRWDQRSQKAGTRVTELEREKGQAEGELTGLEGQLAQTEKLLKSAQEQSGEWEAETGADEKRVTKELDQLRKDYERLKVKRDAADLAGESAALDLKSRREEVDDARDALAKLKSDDAELRYTRRTVANKFAEVQNDMKTFGEADNCPICGEPIRKGSKIDTHLRDLRDRKKEIGEEAAGLDRDLDQSGRAILTAEKLFHRLQKGIETREAAIHAAEADVRLFAPRLAEVQAEVTAHERDLDRLRKAVNPFTDQISKLKREQKKIDDRSRVVADEIEVLYRAVERNHFWVKGFKDIRLMQIEEVLQELELTSNAMLAEVGLPDWQIRYDIEKETKAGTVSRGLNVSIISPQSRNAVRWESWSGGEGQRLRIVGALALSDVLLASAGIDIDMEILDEPTHYLAMEGVRDLCDYLAERAEQLGRRTWLIDHMVRPSTVFTSSITIVKDQDGSRICP